MMGLLMMNTVHRDYGSSKLLSAWEILSTSPVLKQFEWSPLVKGVVLDNLPLVAPELSSESTSNIPGLLAVHLRRGDFKNHAVAWNTTTVTTTHGIPSPTTPTNLNQTIMLGTTRAIAFRPSIKSSRG